MKLFKRHTVKEGENIAGTAYITLGKNMFYMALPVYRYVYEHDFIEDSMYLGWMRLNMFIIFKPFSIRFFETES